MIRVMSVEVFKFCEGDKERRTVWLDLSRRVQQFTNRIWQEWLIYHAKEGTAAKQRVFLDRHAAWKKKEGPKPEPPAKPTPPEFSKPLWATLTQEFSDLNCRVKTLALQRVVMGIGQRKASNGSLPGWVAILLGFEGLPSFTKPLPIPFDRANSKLIAPATDGENWRLQVRLDRLDGTSTADVCELMTRRRKTASMVATLYKIGAGELVFKGSAVAFKDGKWFAQICYDDGGPQENLVELSPDRKAVLMPGRSDPWLLKLDGQLMWRGGTGRHVTAMRAVIARERRARQENYRWASTTTKGHGRNRACDPWTKLSQRWKDFQKRYNHEVTTSIVRECVQKGIGVLEYWQPADDRRDSRFLSISGVTDDRLKGWEYFQIKTMLAYKCERAGVKFSTRVFGARVKADKELQSVGGIW